MKAALQHPNGAGKSDSAIAKHVGVAVQTVNSWRKQMESTFQIGKSPTRTGSDGRTINTANIGRKPEAKCCRKFRATEPVAASARGSEG